MLNFSWLTSLVVFAQENDGGGNVLSPLGPLPPILIIIALFYFILWKPERKKRREHEELVSNLKKNDRVLVMNCIYGTVMNVHSENGDLTVKVDENSNTKLRITRGAVTQVLSGSEISENTA